MGCEGSCGAAWADARAACIPTEHLTASTGLANSTRKPSPVVLTIRPWCSSSSARPKSGPCKRSLKAEFHVSELDWLALQHLKIVEDRPAGGDHQRGPARASAPL